MGGSHGLVAPGNTSLSLSLSSSSDTAVVRPSYDLATFVQHLRYSLMFFIMARAVLLSVAAADDDDAGLPNCCDGRAPVRGRDDCSSGSAAGTNGNTRTQSPSESTGLRQSRPLPHTGDMTVELHLSAAAYDRWTFAPRCLPGPNCRDDWRADGSNVVDVTTDATAAALLLLWFRLLLLLLLLLLLIFVIRFDFHFSVAAAAKADGRPPPLPPNLGPDADRHAMRNSDRPVLHIGNPSKSNMSCNSGFFTWLSTSQSFPSAGLRLTWNHPDRLELFRWPFKFVIFIIHLIFLSYAKVKGKQIAFFLTLCH